MIREVLTGRIELLKCNNVVTEIVFIRSEEEIEGLVSEQLGDSPDFPVKLVKIAKHLNYGVFYLDESDRDIIGKVDHNQKAIFIRDIDSLQRQRFTVAHEIGHILLHKKEGSSHHYRAGRTEDITVYGGDIEEIEANKFASMLLMPKNEFQKIWNRFNGDIEYVSDYFAVSKLVASIRANSLGLMSL